MPHPSLVDFAKQGGDSGFDYFGLADSYFVRPPSVFSLSLAAACAAASRAVNTRNGEHET